MNMSKGPGREFGRVDNGEVDRYLSEVRQIATSTDWASISRNDFIATSATVFAYVNQAHPFREGNDAPRNSSCTTGRRFTVPVRVRPRDARAVEPGIRHEPARPDKHVPDPTSLVPIFHAISVEKPAPAADPLATSEPSSAPAYQRSPKEATRAPARAASSRPRRVAAAPATCPTGSRQEGSRNDEKVRGHVAGRANSNVGCCDGAVLFRSGVLLGIRIAALSETQGWVLWAVVLDLACMAIVVAAIKATALMTQGDARAHAHGEEA